MPKVKRGDFITISCSGVHQCYKVSEPKAMLCEMIYLDTGKPTGGYFNLKITCFGLDESMTIFAHWGKEKPSRMAVVEHAGVLWEKQCQNET